MFYGATTAASISHENMFKHIGKVAPYDVIVLSLRYAFEKACGSVTEKKRNRGQMSLISIGSKLSVKSQNSKYTLLKNVQIYTTFFLLPKI